MNNADRPAMPTLLDDGTQDYNSTGLTKREHIATHFATALVRHYETSHDAGRERIASEACLLADALLKELENTP